MAYLARILGTAARGMVNTTGSGKSSDASISCFGRVKPTASGF